VFTPSLFVGAAAGSVFAQAAVLLLPLAWVGDPRVLAVIGMAAVLAAVTHAPLMAIVMVLEMTHQFQLTVPAMLACGVAYAISTQFGGRPLYGNPIEAHR
jgi:CIC family chloride channel protein